MRVLDMRLIQGSLRRIAAIIAAAALVATLATATSLSAASAQPAMCQGQFVTVDIGAGELPTSDDDVILGTAGDDTIAAGDGNDLVCAGPGDDTVWGQGGNDMLWGGDGNDKLRGGSDDDSIHGEAGDDDLAGGTGNDSILGGTGNDQKLRGGTGDDSADGGPGNDVLIAGNGGEDDLAGGPGDDRVTGGPRPDVLRGGEGNDLLQGHKGADELFGDAGDDDLRGGQQPDIVDGGEGNDTCNGGTTGEGAPESDTSLNCESTINFEDSPAPPPVGVFAPGELLTFQGAISANQHPTDVGAVVASDRLLGIDVFTRTAGDSNTMISPYSIATALGMLYAGAGGETAAQMADVLRLSVDPATLHSTRGEIDRAIATVPNLEGTEAFQIRPANSIWGQGGFPFSDAYLETLATDYAAGMRLVDFVGDPQGSTGLINDWVADATEDRIQDLVPPGSITTDTRLVLANAIWFKANWTLPFSVDQTADLPFTGPSGETVDVATLRGNPRVGFASTPSFDAVRLPYSGGAHMVVALPAAGSTPLELASSFDPNAPIAWQDAIVDLSLPKFSFESTTELGAALKALGMTDVFSPALANLQPITGGPNGLLLSDALHKSFIALDENGTEAAAATALVVGIVSVPQPATLTVDRPFLFWIEHDATGEMLFLGQVTNPAS